MKIDEYPTAWEEMQAVFKDPPSALGDILLVELTSCLSICDDHDVPEEMRPDIICEAYRHAHYDVVDEDIDAIRMDIEELL